MKAERLGQILELIDEAGSVSVDDLAERLNASTATIRRDLDLLADQRLVARTHGGARKASSTFDLPLHARYGRRSAQKQQIAEVASSLVTPGQVIGLSGGTTLTGVADAIGARIESDERADTALTVVTNAINIAAQLVLRPRIRVVVPGGVVHSRSFELTGPIADQALGALSLDAAFIGVDGIDLERGAMVQDDQEARINALMAERARVRYLVADSSKIGERAFVTIGDLDRFDALVTDDGVDAGTRAAIEDAGLRVITDVDAASGAA